MLNFNSMLLNEMKKLQESNIEKLKDLRAVYKEEVDQINQTLTENISFGKRKFLKGKRKILTMLLDVSKKYLTAVNVVCNRKTSDEFQESYIDNLPEELEEIQNVDCRQQKIKTSAMIMPTGMVITLISKSELRKDPQLKRIIIFIDKFNQREIPRILNYKSCRC